MFQFAIEESQIQNSNEKPSRIFEIGDRILVENSAGVVRYVGEVGGYPGLWLGVEWDNPGRGKHNGSVDGIKYFECKKDDESTASFVRPQKARKTTNIISALHERYGFDEDIMAKLHIIDDRVEKMKVMYSKITLMDLSSKNLTDIKHGEELAALCPNILEMCLAENFIQSWIDIVELCRLFNLTRLDLSDNPLQAREDLESYPDSFRSLEHLILGRLGYTWDNILQTSVLWPQISILQAPYNNVREISSPSTTVLQNLTQLDLGANQIYSWEEVLKLNSLERLEYLNLSGNKIIQISFPDDGNMPTSFFSKLIRLNASENKIIDWASVNELNKLNSLRELRIELNPFLEKNSKANNREIIIAKIENLMKLEGVEISNQERRDSELDYVKKFSTHWTSVGSKGFVEAHPRFPDLERKYGECGRGELSLIDKPTKIEVLTLELIPLDHSFQPFKKEFNPEMSVQKLRLFLQRMYKKKFGELKMEVVSTRNPAVRFEISNDFFSLDQYSIEDSDKLIISW